jgi:hypothetical protein
MAIQILDTPQGQSRAGIFTLPADFDTKKFASKWVKRGAAADAVIGQREHIVGTNFTADPWEVWRDGKNKPHSNKAKDGEYVLLCRPRQIQDEVNAIYGNVGKQRQLAEKRGETAGGVQVLDPGFLGDDRLSKVIGSEGSAQDGEVILNKVTPVMRVSTPAIPINSNPPEE